MFSRNKSVAVCILAAAVMTSGCANLTESLSSDFHEKRGLSLFEQGDFPKAEEELKLAISLAARDSGPKAGPVARMNSELADLYKKQEKLEFADEGYRRALIIFSEKPDLLNDEDREAWVKCLKNYAEVLRATGRKDEADIRESQAQRILEKMGKAAPAQAEKEPPAAAPATGKPEEKPAPATQPDAKDQGAEKVPAEVKPETKTEPAKPAAATPAEKKPEAKPAATTAPATKPAPAKPEAKPAATTTPAAKPAPGKSDRKPAPAKSQ